MWNHVWDWCNSILFLLHPFVYRAIAYRTFCCGTFVRCNDSCTWDVSSWNCTVWTARSSCHILWIRFVACYLWKEFNVCPTLLLRQIIPIHYNMKETGRERGSSYQQKRFRTFCSMWVQSEWARVANYSEHTQNIDWLFMNIMLTQMFILFFIDLKFQMKQKIFDVIKFTYRLIWRLQSIKWATTKTRQNKSVNILFTVPVIESLFVKQHVNVKVLNLELYNN